MSILTCILVVATTATMSFTADKMAVDNVTKAGTAEGRVVAVSKPFTVRAEKMSRDVDGVMHFYDPTCATTCSNEVGHTHWNVTGDIVYRDKDYVILRNTWLKFCELPIFWLPYLYYPLDTDCGFSWMPGYTSRWGAYLLTKYRYNIIGDPEHKDNTWWLKGDTRLDLRSENGIALGEDFKWNLGDYGQGKLNFYYAWDDDFDRRGESKSRRIYHQHWGSEVDRDRYMIGFEHRWEATERDTVRLQATYLSDSYFRDDFMRRTFFDRNRQWLTYDNSGVFWEHIEDGYAAGVEVSGRLNDFYGMTDRLPEFYFDINPMPAFTLFGMQFNYESQNRFGYLSRNPAEYAAGAKSVYGYNPGAWADFSAYRLDTYHRLTMPFKMARGILAVVPRIGYRGTFWSETGYTTVSGYDEAGHAGSAFRSIGELGATFAARGTGLVDDRWSHRVEPYLDVLMQEAWYDGIGSNNRPYIFDNLDGSMAWEDQYAGRSRNLPYSYYGITPGARHTWSMVDENGRVRDVFEIDGYAAAQFNLADYTAGSDAHRLARVGSPNYGSSSAQLVPGMRMKWTPDDDISMGVRGEYNLDDNCIALASAFYRQRLNREFSYYVNYGCYDYRYWDFASTRDAVKKDGSTSDAFNFVNIHMATFGFEQQVCDWLAWSPHLRWDCRENEIDTVGTWVDYMTDCLGFRFLIEYENEYEMLDGYHRKDDYSIGFYIYLRAFGANGSNILGD